MSTCDTTDLVGYLEGEDPGGKTADHLRSCPRCRDELRVLERLVEGLIATRRSARGGCPRESATVSAAAEEEDTEHLAACPACRHLFDTIRGALEDADTDHDASQAPLPQAVRERVRARRREYARNRLRKVLDLQGIKDRKTQDKRIQEILDQDLSDLPLAAYPDDLAGEDEEDDPEE